MTEVKRRSKRTGAAQAIQPDPAEHPGPATGLEPAKLTRLLLQSVLSSDRGSAPTMAQVAGAYWATVFTSLEGGLTSNRLTHGSGLDMVLNPDGTSTGLLRVAEAAAGGCGLDTTLTGKWTLHGDTVELDLKNDAFVSEMAFLYHDGMLEAEQSFGARVTRIVLTRVTG